MKIKSHVHCFIFIDVSHTAEAQAVQSGKRLNWHLLKLKLIIKPLPSVWHTPRLDQQLYLVRGVNTFFVEMFVCCCLEMSFWCVVRHKQWRRYKMSVSHFISMSGEEQLVESCRIESPALSLSLSSSLLLPLFFLFFFTSLTPFAFLSTPFWNHSHLNSYSACNEMQMHTITLPGILQNSEFIALFTYPLLWCWWK